MTLRVSTKSNYTRLLSGLRLNTLSLVRAQEQIATGRRVLRPSDDPTGTARILTLERQLADVGRFREAASSGRTLLDTGSSSLQDASTLLSEARTLLLQGMNGTLTDQDREGLAQGIALLRDQLIDIANAKQGDRFLFGGTQTSDEPFQVRTINGRERVVYVGDDAEQQLEISAGSYLGVNVVGSEVFDRFEPSGTTFVGGTGVASGTTADQGLGFDELVLRHDSTDLGTAAGAGIALVAGGSQDTFLGVEQLVVDTAAGTIRLGDGPAVALPAPGDPEYADLVLQNGDGGELRLDLTAWSGADFTGDVTGEGSIALGTGAFVPLDFTETDLKLKDDANGTTLHVDLTAVGRAGRELVSFSGTANVFDVLAGIEDDLLNTDALSREDVSARLTERLGEFDRNHENVLIGLGVLGARSKRIEFSTDRANGLEVQIETLLSDARDADFAEVALDLARAETTLQTAQASGARLIQNTLLNFLR